MQNFKTVKNNNMNKIQRNKMNSTKYLRPVVGITSSLSQKSFWNQII